MTKMKNQIKINSQKKVQLLRFLAALILFFNAGFLHAQSNEASTSKFSYKDSSSYIIGQIIVPLQPILSSLDNKMIGNFSISPALPPGLSLDPATGIISGTPTTISGFRNYQICGNSTDHIIKSCANILLGIGVGLSNTSGTQGG